MITFGGILNLLQWTHIIFKWTWVWWHVPAIPAFRRWKAGRFEAWEILHRKINISFDGIGDAIWKIHYQPQIRNHRTIIRLEWMLRRQQSKTRGRPNFRKPHKHLPVTDQKVNGGDFRGAQLVKCLPHKYESVGSDPQHGWSLSSGKVETGSL